jgi:hypothetical protein
MMIQDLSRPRCEPLYSVGDAVFYTTPSSMRMPEPENINGVVVEVESGYYGSSFDYIYHVKFEDAIVECVDGRVNTYCILEKS